MVSLARRLFDNNSFHGIDMTFDSDYSGDARTFSEALEDAFTRAGLWALDDTMSRSV